MHKVLSLFQSYKSYNLIQRESCYSSFSHKENIRLKLAEFMNFVFYSTHFTLANQKVRERSFADLNSILIRSIPASRVLS